MLVPEKIVKQWYKPSSRVYKNFKYLFQNPLWDKPMPKGFTVCPYFWLSLFSMFVLRPFVLLMTCVVLPLMKKCGAPLVTFDKKVRAYGLDNFADMNGGGIVQIFLGLLAMVVIPVALLLLYHFVLLAPTFSGKLTLLSIEVVAACLLAGTIYGKKNSNFPAFSVGLGAIATGLLFNGVVYINHVIGAILFAVSMIVWLVTMIFVLLWSALSYSPFWGVSWVIDAAVFFGVSYVFFSKFYDVEFESKILDGADAVNDFTNEWYRYANDAFSFHQKSLTATAVHYWMSKNDHDGDSELLRPYMRGFIQRKSAELTKHLAETYKTVSPEKGYSAKFDGVDLNSKMKMASHDHSNRVWDMEDEIVNYAVEQFSKSPRLIARYHADIARRERFLEYTAHFGKLFDATMGGIVKYTRPALKFIGWILKGIVTIACYLWIIAKAKKKGACPYIMFDKE